MKTIRDLKTEVEFPAGGPLQLRKYGVHEWYADCFALYLLMPDPHFQNKFVEFNGDYAALGRFFGVERSAIEARLFLMLRDQAAEGKIDDARALITDAEYCRKYGWFPGTMISKEDSIVYRITELEETKVLAKKILVKGIPISERNQQSEEILIVGYDYQVVFR